MGRKINLLKSNFSSGEIDPDLAMRTDIKHYYSGAAYLSDVVVKPQGGIKRRDGLKWLADLTALIPDDQSVRLVPFEFSVDDTYLLIFLDEEIQVVKDAAIIHTISSTPWTAAQLRSINWTQSYDTLIVFHREVAPTKIVRVTDTNWTVTTIAFGYIPKYDYAPASSTPAGSITPSAVSGKVTVTGVGTTFTSAYVGQKIEGNGGLMRVVQRNSNTEVIAVVEIPFFSTASISTGSWTYLSGYEDAWSVTRGWPVCGSFHGGRLYLGGGPRPSTLWGSRVGSYFDFEPLTALDDEPVEVTLDNDGLNQIVNIMSLRDLIIFTTGGEFVETQKPITPNNIAPLQQTRRGSEPDSKVIELEGAALFVQRKGKAIREFYYTDTEGSYVAENLTLLASHLMENPIDFVKRRASSTSESDLLIVVNETGSARMCSIIRSQEIVAWTRITTGGDFIACGLDDDEIYFIVKRVINGSTKYFLEKFDADHKLDASVRVTAGLPTNTVTAAHLPSTEVTAFADDADLGDITLNGSGVGTISRNASDYYEVGLNHLPDAISMPIEQDFQEGTSIGNKKRIVEATLELRDTSYIEVNENRVAFRKFGSDLLDKPPTKFTGRVTEEGILGYSDKAQLRITQSRPGSMDLLGIAVKVSF
jgi:hypothetical protein